MVSIWDIVIAGPDSMPSRNRGREGVVVDLIRFEHPYPFVEAWVRFSERFGDTYAIRVERLIKKQGVP